MWTPEEARRKIAALFAKANAAGTPEEALAFAHKAAELARTYGIDPAELHPDRIDESRVRKAARAVPMWRAYLADAAARLNNCAVVLSGGELRFIGRQGDRITAELMAAYFEKAAQRAATAHGATVITPMRRAAIARFRMGFAANLCHRAREACPLDDEVQRHLAERGNLKARRTTARASAAGWEAGAATSLHRQATGAPQLALGQRRQP